MQIHDGGAPCVPALQLDDHVRIHAAHDARVDHPGDGDRIVQRRVREPPQRAVGRPEEGEQLGADVPQFGAQPLESGDDLGCGERLVRDVQTAHGERNTAAEDDVRGFRIRLDVELGGRGPVAPLRRAAHEDDLPDEGGDIGMAGQQQGDVGQRRRRDEGDRLRVPGQDPVHEVHRVLGDHVHGGFGEARPVETGHAVHVVRHLQCLDQRAGAAGRDGHIGDARDRADPARVQCGLLERLIACDRGDGQQVDCGVTRRKHDREGVVVSGVAVDDDRYGHALSCRAAVTRPIVPLGHPRGQEAFGPAAENSRPTPTVGSLPCRPHEPNARRGGGGA